MLLGGSIADYTARKNREESERENDRRFREQFYPDGVIPDDPDKKYELDRRAVAILKGANNLTSEPAVG